jgi:hypothetical protein
MLDTSTGQCFSIISDSNRPRNRPPTQAYFRRTGSGYRDRCVQLPRLPSPCRDMAPQAAPTLVVFYLNPPRFRYLNEVSSIDYSALACATAPVPAQIFV